MCGADDRDRGGREADPLPPWEDPRAAFPRNFLDTWFASVTRPAAFFRGVPFDRAAARPILYYLIISIIGATFSLWWTSVFTTIGLPLADGYTGPWTVLSPAANAMFSFFAAPFLAFFGLIVWAGLVQLLTVMFAKRARGYRATVRAICYGSSPHILSVVPVIGGLVGFFWSLALIAIGLREAHGMSQGAAIGVVGLAVLIPFILLLAIFALAFASLAAIV